MSCGSEEQDIGDTKVKQQATTGQAPIRSEHASSGAQTSRQAQDTGKQLNTILMALSVDDKPAVAQEAEVLQTYIVGNRQVLEETQLWMQPIGTEPTPWRTQSGEHHKKLRAL